MKTSSIIICLIIAITFALVNESHAWPFGDADEKVDELNQKINIIISILRKMTSFVKQNSNDIEAINTGGLVTNNRANIMERLEELEQQLEKVLS